jgi:hypothetical protein
MPIPYGSQSSSFAGNYQVSFKKRVCECSITKPSQSVESLLPASGFNFGDLVPMAKVFTSYVLPTRKSPFDDLIKVPTATKEDGSSSNRRRTEVLRGWLTAEQGRDSLIHARNHASGA